MISAVHRGTHEVRCAGIYADIVLINLFFMNHRRNQVSIWAGHKAAKFRKDGDVVHFRRNEDLFIGLSYALSYQQNIRRFLLRTIGNPHAAR